jgi:hypothetical protein
MKAVLVTSIVCAVAGLLGLLGLSAMTVAPGAEGGQLRMMLLVGMLTAAWLCLAFWTGAQLRSPLASTAMPRRLKTAVVVGGVVFIFLVLLFSVG